MSEESITLQAPASERPYTIKEIQIASHPDHWGKVLQANTGQSVLLAKWEKYDTNYPIPKDANIPMTEQCVQNLFDSLWRQGYRPTGTRVTLEELPDVSDERLAELAAMKDEDIDTSDIPELTQDITIFNLSKETNND